MQLKKNDANGTGPLLKCGLQNTTYIRDGKGELRGSGPKTSAVPAVSKVTLASLADIGFEIDYIMAEPYALPAPMQIQTPPRSCVIGAEVGCASRFAVAELPA